MHKFLFYNEFIMYLYMFRALLCSIIRRSKLLLYSIWYRHTLWVAVRCTGWERTGGQNCIIQHLVSSHCVGGRPVNRLREDRRSKLYYTASGIVTLCRWPSGAQVERGQEVKIVLYSIWYRHTVGGRPVHRLREDRRSKLYYTASGIVTL